MSITEYCIIKGYANENQFTLHKAAKYDRLVEIEIINI